MPIIRMNHAVLYVRDVARTIREREPSTIVLVARGSSDKGPPPVKMTASRSLHETLFGSSEVRLRETRDVPIRPPRVDSI